MNTKIKSNRIRYGVAGHKVYRERTGIFSAVIFFFFSFAAGNVIASDYVTIATIGTLPSVSGTHISQSMVDHVIGFWEKQLDQVIYDKPDLIVLPEHAGLPRGIKTEERREYLKVRRDQILDYFRSVSKEHHCYIAFGMLRKDPEGAMRNSLILINREGEVMGIYNKNYPTVYEMEWGIKPGTRPRVFKCDFGTVGLAICFDLNFDELRVQYAALKPDIMVFSSAYHGGLVQNEWAYSCRSFSVGAISGRGCFSQIRNPLGEVVASSTNYFDYAVTKINLDSRLVHLDYNWGKLRALKKKYGPGVTITDPGYVGAVLVSSNIKDVSINKMIKEFDIELLDHYFDRSRAFRLSKLNKKPRLINANE